MTRKKKEEEHQEEHVPEQEEQQLVMQLPAEEMSPVTLRLQLLGLAKDGIIDNKKYKNFLKKYKNKELYNEVSILISEWANGGDMLDFIRKNYKEFDVKHWRILFFQASYLSTTCETVTILDAQQNSECTEEGRHFRVALRLLEKEIFQFGRYLIDNNSERQT